MTIDVQAAGTLAQIYPVALLILALEGRFLRTWVGGRAITALRYIWTIIGFVALIVTLMAEAALVQAVITNEPLEGGSSVLIVVAGWSLTIAVGAFLGGAMSMNTSPHTRAEG